jgi:hypothetical protein
LCIAKLISVSQFTLVGERLIAVDVIDGFPERDDMAD